MNVALPRRPVVLCVFDGWGYRPETEDNAIALAATPVFDRLMSSCPNALLDTCGTEVGLPSGQMGNSEVGHLNLGAGRIVAQDIQRIDAAIGDATLDANPVLARLIARLRESNGTCHLMGLVSPGGVHSHQDHIAALARILDEAGIPVAIHAFLDGRDTPPASAAADLAAFRTGLSGLRADIVTVCGRYFAMDRDKRWDRIERAYAMLTTGAGERAADPVAAVRASYEAGTTDEFVAPTVIGDYAGMADGDGVLMANFRADRARQILTALVEPKFEGFKRPRIVGFADAVGMVEYADSLNRHLATLFASVSFEGILAEVLADAGLKQLRIAETEKYPHVTFFFNGGVEAPFPGEERILIPSPKVATYDLQPEMSANEVTDKLVEAIGTGRFDFIFVNYANADMVGHTGFLAPAITAIETVDTSLGRLVEAVERAGGVLLVTADHGNAELMRDAETGEPFTAHTLNRVPVILVNGGTDINALADGRLSDVAPTLLALMELPQPKQMTGQSLLAGADKPSGLTHERVSA